MFESLVMTLALALPAADDDRKEAANRPSRAQISRIESSARLTPPRWRPFQECIVDRESGGNPSARNPSSSASGTYQFLDNDWRDGLAYMVAERLKEFGIPARRAKEIRVELQGTHISEWPPRYQDIGFAEVISRPGTWKHWYLSGSRCNGLVP